MVLVFIFELEGLGLYIRVGRFGFLYPGWKVWASISGLEGLGFYIRVGRFGFLYSGWKVWVSISALEGIGVFLSGLEGFGFLIIIY